MSERVSSQAMTWLTFFIQNPDLPINYRTLMDAGLSRRRGMDVLRELKARGILRTVTRAGGGSALKIVHSEVTTLVSSEVTSAVSSEYSYIAVQLVSSISNSNTARTTYKATNKFSDGVGEEEKNMGYDFFESTSSGEDDDALREKAKYQAQKKAEYAEERLKAKAKKDAHRSKMEPVNWSCKDVAYEFADRMSNLWSIAPFSVAQSRFVQALAVFRKQYDTDGALELELINLFFSSLNAEKYNDGNHLWRAFLYKAPSLLETARERTISAEVRETDLVRDQELASKKISMFEDEDV